MNTSKIPEYDPEEFKRRILGTISKEPSEECHTKILKENPIEAQGAIKKTWWISKGTSWTISDGTSGRILEVVLKKRKKELLKNFPRNESQKNASEGIP